MLKFVETDKGIELLKKYSEYFEGMFALMEPMGLVLDVGVDDYVFIVPEWETPSDFEATLQKSIADGINHFIERYKDFKTVLQDDVLY